MMETYLGEKLKTTLVSKLCSTNYLEQPKTQFWRIGHITTSGATHSTRNDRRNQIALR